MSAAQGTHRLGVLGGAFDPPHIAHVALAELALAELALDELRVLPTGQAWHKARPLTGAVHRLTMARLAFAHLARVVVDARELQRSGPSYTIDTLHELAGEFAQTQLFLLLGSDQAAALTTWHRWPEILQSATLCVATRAGFTGAIGQFDAEKQSGQQFLRLPLPALSVSSTQIRATIARQGSAPGLIHPDVSHYIHAHSLYTTHP